MHPYLEEEGESSSDEYDEGDLPIDEQQRKPSPRSHHHRRLRGACAGGGGGGLTTKHDAVLCGRKNVRNMEKFPPDFPAGDLNEKGQDYRLSNAVFNTLKQHSQKEEKYVS